MSKKKMLANPKLWNRQKHQLEDLYDLLISLENSISERDKKLFTITSIEIRSILRVIKNRHNF